MLRVCLMWYSGGRKLGMIRIKGTILVFRIHFVFTIFFLESFVPAVYTVTLYTVTPSTRKMPAKTFIGA